MPSATVTNVQDLFNRGVEKTERGDLQGAIEDFDGVVRLNPSFIEAYCNRGFVCAELGNYKAAMVDFN